MVGDGEQVNEVRQKGRAIEVREETRWERHVEWRAAEQVEVIAAARRSAARLATERKSRR